MSYNEVLQKVEDSLTKIRPFLHADGGDVKVAEFTSDYSLKLEFIGACKDCSMNRMTFKAGIEENIKRDVPEVKSIEAIGV
jgi:Fe-S cluster biogenesis protein NfuA